MALFSPKMRWKVGSIVPRSRSVSLTSKTIKGGKAMLRDSCSLSPPGPHVVRFSVFVIKPFAVCELFGAIAADRHAAPSSGPPTCMVGEHQRAAMSLARLHIGEIFFTHELSQCLGDRQ